MSDTNQEPRAGHSNSQRGNSGKQNSSRNATTHGLSCETFFLIPGETQEQLDALAQTLADEYREVDSPGLAPLLETLLYAFWLQKRAYKKVFESENALAMAEFSRESPEITEKIFRRLQLMQRYKTSYENSYQRALRAIEAFRKSHLARRLAEVRVEQIVCSLGHMKIKSHEYFMKRGYSFEKSREMMNELYAAIQSAHNFRQSRLSSDGNACAESEVSTPSD